MNVHTNLLCDSRLCGELFFPRYSWFDQAFEVQCDGATLACHFRKFDSENLTVVFFHGNGEVVSEYSDLFPMIMKSFRCNCFLAEYRGYGMSRGNPNLINLIDDVRYIIPAIGEPLDRLILFGRSLGCLPALHAAYLFPGIRGLILESGIADLAHYLNARRFVQHLRFEGHELRDAVQKHFDHQRKLLSFRGFTAMTHFQYDRMVSPSHAHMLFRWAQDPKRLKIYTTGSHNSLFVDNIADYAQVIHEIAAYNGNGDTCPA